MKSTRTVLICAALILMLAMGARNTMGLFMPQMTVAHGWSRDEFAFAIALQNILWGTFVPFAGALADRYGAWLGGVIFTRNSSYDLAWWIALALGVFAAIVTAPIDEKPIARMPSPALAVRA